MRVVFLFTLEFADKPFILCSRKKQNQNTMDILEVA